MKIVGIIGGVGPEASNKFCELLIKYKSRLRDQENLPFVHFCNPKIPDRTDYILGNGLSPVPEIVKTCNVLEIAGADFLVMPCNTAHSFLPEIQKNVNLPIVDMIKVLVGKIKSENPSIKKVGVLATTGSIKSNIFKRYFEKVGIEIIIPDSFDQEKLVMEAIYGKRGIKAGKKLYSRELLNLATKKLINNGAEAIVLGCTEISLAMRQKEFGKRLYDPMRIIAREIIDYIESKEDMDVVTCDVMGLVDKAGKVDFESSIPNVIIE